MLNLIPANTSLAESMLLVTFSTSHAHNARGAWQSLRPQTKRALITRVLLERQCSIVLQLD